MINQILIAEDENLTREAIRRGLMELLPDASFYMAGNGREAVSLAEAHDVQLAFLDIRMPEMDGIAAAQCIAKLRPGCQLIFLTAYSDFEYMRQAVELGALSYILKPFTRTALAVALQKAEERLNRLDSDLRERTQSQLEISRLTHLVEEQTLLQIIGGYQGKESILETLRQKGILFSAGMFAVISCPNARQEERLRSILRGESWGDALRLLSCGEQGMLILLAVSSHGEEPLARFHAQLLKLFERLRGPLHLNVSMGSGRHFTDLQDGQTACFDAFCQMQMADSNAQLFPAESALPPLSLPLIPYAAQLFSIADAYSAPFLLDCVCQYLKLLRFHLRAQRDALARLWELLHPDNAEAREQILHADSEDTLLDTCRSLLAEQSTSLESSGSEEAVRSRIETYMLAHCQDDVSLEQAAEAMQYSPAHFSRLFSRLFGQTFSAYLTSLRLKRAMQLLRETDMSIRDVGRQSGFSDASYFTNVFRRHTGLRPSEYRNGADAS